MWQAATAGAQRLLHCAFQATKSEKCQGNFFTVFHMQRGTEEGEKRPRAAVKAGKEASCPPSSGWEIQGAKATGSFLCSPLGGSLWMEKPVPQTAETCSSSSSSAENPGG